MEALKIIMLVAIFMLLRLLFIVLGVWVMYLTWPHIGGIPAIILGMIVIVFLISVTGGWQWQLGRGK